MNEHGGNDRPGYRAASFLGVLAVAAMLVCALLIGLVAGSGVTSVKAYKIPSGAMIPTLAIGDHILAGGIEPTRSVTYGDVIVFVYPVDPTKDFVKRVIGLPGDRIEIRSRRVYRNGAAIEDSHAHFDPDEAARVVPKRDDFGPFTVPADHYFVLGDNRDHSYDSRFWGPVPAANVHHRAILIYWSWDGQSHRVRFERMGRFVE